MNHSATTPFFLGLSTLSSVMNTSTLPPDLGAQSDDDARRRIIAILRERCPAGFMSTEKLDKIAKLTPVRRKSIAALAAAFPGSLNIQDLDGRTPLAWLVRYDEPALIRQFLELGANPRGAADLSLHGIHPLGQACELRHGPALEAIATAAGLDDILVAVDSDYSSNELPCSGARALFMAAMNTNIRGMATLLALGADPKALTVHGDTPMHALAIFKKNPPRALPCAELLAGDFPDMILAENNAGLTPAALAASYDSPMAAPLLAMEEARRLFLAEADALPAGSKNERPSAPRL